MFGQTILKRDSLKSGALRTPESLPFNNKHRTHQNISLNCLDAHQLN